MITGGGVGAASMIVDAVAGRPRSCAFFALRRMWTSDARKALSDVGVERGGRDDPPEEVVHVRA